MIVPLLLDRSAPLLSCCVRTVCPGRLLRYPPCTCNFDLSSGPVCDDACRSSVAMISRQYKKFRNSSENGNCFFLFKKKCKCVNVSSTYLTTCAHLWVFVFVVVVYTFWRLISQQTTIITRVLRCAHVEGYVVFDIGTQIMIEQKK